MSKELWIDKPVPKSWWWTLLVLVVLVAAGFLYQGIQGGDRGALIQWVRTNDPTNTDSDQELVNLAAAICAAPSGERYQIPTYGLPAEFTSAALGLYCPNK